MNIYFVKDIEPGADPEMEEGDALSGGCCVHRTLHYWGVWRHSKTFELLRVLLRLLKTTKTTWNMSLSLTNIHVARKPP